MGDRLNPGHHPGAHYGYGVTAILRAGFNPEIARAKYHLRVWHEVGAAERILIARKGPKSLALRRIAEALKARRKKKSQGDGAGCRSGKIP
jgi:hypothetical protein